MNENQPSQVVEKPNNKSPIFSIIAILLLLVAGTGGYFVGKYSNQNSGASNTEIQTNQSPQYKEIEPITSPSGQKRIIFKDGVMYLFDGSREHRLDYYDETNSVGAISSVVWSPDEAFVSIEHSLHDYPHTSIFGMDGYDLVFRSIGQFSIYWANNNTAYIGYQHRIPAHRISKFTFNIDKSGGPKIEEEMVYEEQEENNFYAFVPSSVSPNGKYLILEFRYEGIPSLYVLNTATHKMTILNYFISDNPNYSWSGNALTFKGGSTSAKVDYIKPDTFEIDNTKFQELRLDLSKY